jgi:ABC-2 type transport system permease protein
MNTTLTLTKSSIKMFVRNKQALFFTLFSPLLIMAIFGLIGFDRVSKVDVGIVTENASEPTKQFIEQLKQFPTFNVHEGSKEEKEKELDKGNRGALLAIPGNFMDSVSGENAQPRTIRVYINAGKKAEAQTVISVLNQYLDKTTLAAVGAPKLFEVEQREVNSRNLKYFDFLLPGLISLSIMQMSVFSVAFVFAQFKEKGVLKRLLATPMRPAEFVTANVITRLIVAMIQAAIFLLVGILLFKAQVIGSYWLITLVVALGAIMFLGLGFTISGLSKTVETVPAIANLIVFPMLFLGGTFFSIANMPTWLQHFAKFLPLTYFSSALRAVMTENAGFGVIGKDLLGMVVWAVILVVLSMITFGFQEKESA